MLFKLRLVSCFALQAARYVVEQVLCCCHLKTCMCGRCVIGTRAQRAAVSLQPHVATTATASRPRRKIAGAVAWATQRGFVQDDVYSGDREFYVITGKRGKQLTSMRDNIKVQVEVSRPAHGVNAHCMLLCAHGCRLNMPLHPHTLSRQSCLQVDPSGPDFTTMMQLPPTLPRGCHMTNFALLPPPTTAPPTGLPKVEEAPAQATTRRKGGRRFGPGLSDKRVELYGGPMFHVCCVCRRSIVAKSCAICSLWRVHVCS